MSLNFCSSGGADEHSMADWKDVYCLSAYSARLYVYYASYDNNVLYTSFSVHG